MFSAEKQLYLTLLFVGQDQPQPEPEAFDLPDNLQLDDEDGNEKENDEENPFDIDAMKRKITSYPLCSNNS